MNKDNLFFNPFYPPEKSKHKINIVGFFLIETISLTGYMEIGGLNYKI